MEKMVVDEREQLHAQSLQEHGIPLPSDWFEHSSLLSIFFNAASITIPGAEHMVIRTAEAAAPDCTTPELQKSIKNIVHEENAHARVHEAYNDYLQTQGYPVAKYTRMMAHSIAFFERHFSLLTMLGICAATEHFTACGARQVLDVGMFEGHSVDERLDRVWTWHALEELEHRATIFDIYLALGGGYFRRVGAMMLVATTLFCLHHACVIGLMRRQHLLGNKRAWRAASPFLFGKKGIYRHFIPDVFRYFVPGFHPTNFHIKNSLQKQLRHYHIESELVAYFRPLPR